MKPKEIAVYGGSFNPPHRGHREAARTALETLRPDCFLIMPDNTPPHKELEEGSPSPDERLQLCRLCFPIFPVSRFPRLRSAAAAKAIPTTPSANSRNSIRKRI